ncbi:aspartyl-phosphate phosphatase Spo0E family protein [Aquibacillus sp. 3ASR75-11]|uniref:Aspartyl-phosphate phosphatase Spo0E family protein n=1 Tax=Terrihalobacillus insolitus TaxID=2950438 RepID=A0A9X4AL34_9BACI|nr:aspartyl-phosphate phosphatase Spo0E family protein [Terrihalobacillus insolitus]MDC3412747.1 aspartyl-phosphate phosphatase Spo0E family protein [Terrihalobacillus insolitus]MDC3423776.1 aspartyl-phosphate phosphatase Spo0E family protein [Terrihalobacillus insolitus]
MCNLEQLLERIEHLRNKMTEVALKKGFTSEDSIKISQELDRLLNVYESYKNNNKN